MEKRSMLAGSGYRGPWLVQLYFLEVGEGGWVCSSGSSDMKTDLTRALLQSGVQTVEVCSGQHCQNPLNKQSSSKVMVRKQGTVQKKLLLQAAGAQTS